MKLLIRNHVYMHIRYIYIYIIVIILTFFVHPWSTIIYFLILSYHYFRHDCEENFREIIYIYIIYGLLMILKFTWRFEKFFCEIYMEEYFTRVLIRNFEIDIYLEKTICLKKKRCYTLLTSLPSTQIFPLYDFTSTINNSFKKLVTFVRWKFNSTYSYNLSVTRI